MERMIKGTRIRCINNKDTKNDRIENALTVGKVYELHYDYVGKGMYAIIDNEGDISLWFAERFEIVR